MSDLLHLGLGLALYAAGWAVVRRDARSDR